MTFQMNDKETIERMDHGLRKAADALRKIGSVRKSNDYKLLADGVDKLRYNGMDLYRKKQISRQEALAMIDLKVDKMVDQGTVH